ncbi:hypothetical protein F5X96DRAFT_433591 [Biscogniauxia mediterranea]|nr:hypothetical protein F5X96DRAFT_433591 [Biscogniauxia mediterranea]
MSRPRIPSAGAVISAVFRACALVASVVLFANVLYESIIWGTNGKIYWLSLVASLIAIILDSFEVSALIDTTRTIPRLSLIYLICCDLCVLCIAGLSILFIFSSDWYRGSPSEGSWPWTYADRLSLGVTYFICSYRFALLVWDCVDYARARRRDGTAVITPPPESQQVSP